MASSRLTSLRTKTFAAFVAIVGACMPACVTPAASDVHYASGIPSDIADIYLPHGPAIGTIVFVHGGAFSSGAKTDIFEYGRPLLAETARGWAVVSIDYRFTAFPAAVRDLADAVRFVGSEDGRRRGLNADRLVVAGHSAGATIVMDLALSQNEENTALFGATPRVDGWIAASGLTDFRSPASIDPQVAWGTNGAPAAIPLNHLDADDPPGLVVHGTRDSVVSVANALRFIGWARFIRYNRLSYQLLDGPVGCAGHSSMCAATQPTVDRFLDRIASEHPG